MKKLFNFVRLYGLDVLLLGLLERLLDGLCKKVAAARTALSEWIALKKEARLQKSEERAKEKRAD